MSLALKGKKIWLHSFGCRTNQSELESIASGLAELGAALTDWPGSHDALVVMTCSVTAMADKKSRQFVRMARREMPDGLIIACGCWAQQLSPVEATELGIDCVVPNREKSRVVGLIEYSLSETSPPDPLPINGEGEQNVSPPSPFMGREGPGVGEVLGGGWDNLPRLRPTLRSRAFVKIQDGCDRFCSYCIVPFLRGRPVSRPFDDVLDEIASVSALGCEEIILTGTNLGNYKFGLGELVREIAKFPVRLQFGSIEPFSIDEKFLFSLAELGAQFVPPLHIPIQSGDDEILRLMGRGYTADEYLEKISQVRKFLGSKLTLNTDLLVGFPGESEAAFQNSLDIVRKVGFRHVHIFPFSPREGTRAATLENQIPRNIILERAKRAQEVCK